MRWLLQTPSNFIKTANIPYETHALAYSWQLTGFNVL